MRLLVVSIIVSFYFPMLHFHPCRHAPAVRYSRTAVQPYSQAMRRYGLELGHNKKTNSLFSFTDPRDPYLLLILLKFSSYLLAIRIQLSTIFLLIFDQNSHIFSDSYFLCDNKKKISLNNGVFIAV